MLLQKRRKLLSKKSDLEWKWYPEEFRSKCMKLSDALHNPSDNYDHLMTMMVGLDQEIMEIVSQAEMVPVVVLDTLHSTGIVAQLVDLLSPIHQPKLLALILSIMINLSSSENPQFLRILLQTGIVGRMMEIYEETQAIDVATNATWCLSNLLVGQVDVRDEIFKREFIHTIIHKQEGGRPFENLEGPEQDAKQVEFLDRLVQLGHNFIMTKPVLQAKQVDNSCDEVQTMVPIPDERDQLQHAALPRTRLSLC